MPENNEVVVGQLGTISDDGVTIVYDANSEKIYEMKIPKVPVGTELKMDSNGDWKIVFSAGMTKEVTRRLKESEDFYYLTRPFLSYKDYMYVQSRFPTNCATLFKANPFFLTDISRENSDSPICQMPIINKFVVLSTFEDRLREMKYAIKYCLERNEDSGHTWIKYSELSSRITKLLKDTGHTLQRGEVSAYLRYYSKDFYFEENETLSESKVALMTTYNREHSIYRAVAYASNMESPFPLYSPAAEPDLSLEQNKAVRDLISKGGHFSILTGGPGTGKTTIIRTLVDKLTSQYSDAKIYMLAPTGKASKRIFEVFGIEDVQVSTVHKFLGYGHTLTRRDFAVIKSADLIIVDEASMLDLQIFEDLITMLNLERTKVILVGDVDQLPSIGAGNVLSDLIHLGVHTERLTENYRSVGSIISNAIKINKGVPFLEKDEFFKIMEVPLETADFLSGMDSETDIVITPYKMDGKNGSTKNVNEIAQSRRFSFPAYNGFHVGDVVIMLHTNYKQGYFNGESGVIVSHLPNGDYIVPFGDREIVVKDIDDMALGYAITVHKSQGSEYDCVDICIPEFSEFITRKMLYTAVTRAKKKVKIWVRNIEVLYKVIFNNPEETRRTFLSSFPKISSDLS